jgi:polysaccharide pyruvyl transferase WcaK-like protein
VVNGEGTLHRLSKGAMTLLYMIYLAGSMRKKVFLINHSCFPMGDTSRGDTDLIYQAALSGLEDIVVREPLSALFYQAHSIDSRQGFDSLPLFIGRHDLLGLRADGVDKGKIVLCGGIAYSQKLVATIGRLLAGLGSGHNFEFLVGGKADLAREDMDVFKQFEQTGLTLKLREAKTFEEWCRTIAGAELIVSGRFHYTVAAMSLAVPCISFPSNTPKIEGIHRMFSLDGYLEWEDQNFTDRFTVLLERAKNNELILTDQQRLEIIEKAENNYARLA